MHHRPIKHKHAAERLTVIEKIKIKEMMDAFLVWLRGFLPVHINASWREKLTGCVGASVGLLFAASVSKVTFGDLNPWFIAPMGASAVLLFAVPSSPLAQPWSIMGGNTIAALIGIACAQNIPHPMPALVAAGGLSIAAMFALRCLHPPGSAIALSAVLGGPAVLAKGYSFAWCPVAMNSLFLLAAALLFNNLLGRRYPHAHTTHVNTHKTADAVPTERLGVTRADLDHALQERQEILDVDPEDLEDLFIRAEWKAYQRRYGEIRCSDLMSKDVVCIHPTTPLQEAWQLLSKHKIKALPVVNEAGELAGIVSLHDLLVGHSDDFSSDSPQPWPPQLRAQRVEEVMTRQVKTADPSQLITDLVPLLSDAGYHHLPVINTKRHVVGMVTQSDLVAALYRVRLEEAG